MSDAKRVARLYLRVADSDLYPDAGKNAPTGVREAIKEWEKLPKAEKLSTPLWHWLLGNSTPAYKLPPDAADYIDKSPLANRTCANCEYAYQHVASESFICSMIRGQIKLPGWCRLWSPFDHKRHKPGEPD